MFDHVVVYSPLNHLSPQFVRKLGLIYDRVVIPLPDAIRSGRIKWLNDLAEACPYMKEYLKALDTVYSDETGFCRPLDMTEYPALAMDSEAFRQDFFRYIGERVSDKEWRTLVNTGIDVAQDVLNFFVTQDYAAECRQEKGQPPAFVFPFRDEGGGDGPMVRSIADVLRLEATRCALHGFQLPDSPQQFNRVLKLSKTLESRYALQKYLHDSAVEIHAAVNRGAEHNDTKEILRKYVLEIADSYNKFLEDLEMYSRVVKVYRLRGSNSLRIARRTVRLKWKLKAEAKSEFLRVALNIKDQYSNQHRELLKEAGDLVLNAEHRWQCDLLTFRCDADREFGRNETYKNLREKGFWDFIRSKIA